MSRFFSSDEIERAADGSINVTFSGQNVTIPKGRFQEHDGDGVVVSDKKFIATFRKIAAQKGGRKGTARSVPTFRR